MSRYIDADKLNGYEFGLISPKAQDLFHKTINNAPTEDVKPIVYGNWILADEQNKEDVENDNYRFICSECQCSDIHSKKTKVSYCWNCGADMRKE